MEYTIILDGIRFTAKKEDIDKIIEFIAEKYKSSRINRSLNSQIICDSDLVNEYIIHRLLEKLDNLIVYDFAGNKTPNFQESFYSLLKLEKKVIAKGLEEYAEFLQQNFYNGRQRECNFIMMDEAKLRIYYQSFNFRRDTDFNENKAKVLFILSNNESTIFTNAAYDFISQHGDSFDINKCFKPVLEADYKDLSEYLNRINAEERCVKEYKLKQEESNIIKP